MIEHIWFKQNHPLKYLLWPILWFFSVFFYLVIIIRIFLYRSSIKKSYRPPVAVIVVGNIIVGGTGKTPFVIWLVNILKKRGFKPGVVSRGYGGNALKYPLIVEKTTLVQFCGDEPKLIQERTGAIVVVSPIRNDAVKVLLSLDIDVIISDDGLQHYALERDIEISIVDSIRRFGNNRLIPLGPLREPVTRLSKVDFIISNGGRVLENEISMKLKPSLAINLKTGKKVSVAELGKLVAFAGIGYPARFFHTLKELGAHLVATKSFSDHKTFQVKELDLISSQGTNLIMTEKDAIKCRCFAKEHWWYLPVSANFDIKDEQRIINKISEVVEFYGSSTT
ncbi:tetraacyldisaccharide 4'-kinase [Candidatus Photodesmus katoptron]|uniref:Tetraacyldisaccharide 4'-kinase n=1 Tax=Candidatus Photodesmus katoptron Akat1 TaxID=1236703 RepID=S3E0X3_9GAMM|nr:tetraacyldisaccharide 4'-kinase [Candidatus Photodesmus katoptron]EPE37796.1 tetraacyldisaccharide 4'-kinase [Candidatus Photodesmus katoptron Akat1]KEY90483.1 tetraacyldisaccharide 4'-kinase [Candidatus Photodesmus katoptron]